MAITSDYSSRTTVGQIWRFLSQKRIQISLFVVCSLIAMDVICGVRPHSVFNVYDPWSTIGQLLILVGLIVRSWAAGVLQKNAVLCTSGPYAISRNPLYLGSFMMMIGFCSLIGALHSFVIMLLLALLLYWPKIIGEERHLQKEFGLLWSEYARSTPRLLPYRPAINRIQSDWTLAQWWHNEEYMAVLGTALGLAVFGVWFVVSR